MRGFGRFSERKLTQISLQTATLVEISIIYAIFGDCRQRSHSNAALPRGEFCYYPIPVSFLQQRQRVVGCHNGRMLVLTGQFDLYE